MQNQIFTASRFTSGNLIFPVRIEVNQDRVTRIKPKLFGSNEESITISKVASVNIETGIIWSNIRIDSAGGSNPILSHGHSKGDARTIRDLIEQLQKLVDRIRVAEMARGNGIKTISRGEFLSREVFAKSIVN